VFKDLFFRCEYKWDTIFEWAEVAVVTLLVWLNLILIDILYNRIKKKSKPKKQRMLSISLTKMKLCSEKRKMIIYSKYVTCFLLLILKFNAIFCFQ